MVSVTSGYRESTQSWSEALRDLKRHGLSTAGDRRRPPGHLGSFGVYRALLESSDRLLTKLPKRVHKPALLILRQIPYAGLEKKHNDSRRFFSTGAGSEG